MNLSVADFRRVLAQCGAGLIGQTAEIAPADKKLYALRDVTGTVESPYLICASIMSKKLAEGIDALVLDVKTGSGAFMKSEKDAVFLAELMVETGQRLGKRVSALITDMDQPLGRAVGNALEVAECIDVLNGRGPDDLRELSIVLSAWMFLLGKRVGNIDEGRELAEQMIASGKAREKFREMIRLQGGNAAVMDDPGLLPQAAQKSKSKVQLLASLRPSCVSRLAPQECFLAAAARVKKIPSIPPWELSFTRKLGIRLSSAKRSAPFITIQPSVWPAPLRSSKRAIRLPLRRCCKNVRWCIGLSGTNDCIKSSSNGRRRARAVGSPFTPVLA